jgi:hypothetical protein
VLSVVPPNVPWLYAIAVRAGGRHPAVARPDGTALVVRPGPPGRPAEVTPRLALPPAGRAAARPAS